MKLKILLTAQAKAIAARMKELGIVKVEYYITELIRNDLQVQKLRKRYGILPMSAQRMSWVDIAKTIKNKVRFDYRRWRDGDWDDDIGLKR